jgi:hypothetical protein
MDPHDTVVLECRTAQFEGLARVALKMQNHSEARSWMAKYLENMRAMVSRNASVRDYIFDYSKKLELARELGFATNGFD